jgi:rhodanese-related sulfurtransferase
MPSEIPFILNPVFLLIRNLRESAKSVDDLTFVCRDRLSNMATGFEKLVEQAKKNITEVRPTDAATKMKGGNTVIVDVREKGEWDEEHIPDAIHMSRGMLELDIEEKVPDVSTTVIVHCGGGGRSALAAESLQKMGYKNVRSMAGGFKAWKAAGLPSTR